jgi:hypothetical protein
MCFIQSTLTVVTIESTPACPVMSSLWTFLTARQDLPVNLRFGTCRRSRRKAFHIEFRGFDETPKPIACDRKDLITFPATAFSWCLLQNLPPLIPAGQNSDCQTE